MGSCKRKLKIRYLVPLHGKPTHGSPERQYVNLRYVAGVRGDAVG